MNPSLQRKKMPLIALAGRANVGKSTLWNKVVERKRALVSPLPHTTRDRNVARALWMGREFEMVDTGGLDVEANEIGRGIKTQAERAVKEADLVLFMVDGKTGIVGQDRELASRIRKLNKNVILVVNKIDQPRDMANAADRGIYGMGLGDPVAISASTGKGVGDLLETVFKRLEALGIEAPEAEIHRKDRKSKDTSVTPDDVDTAQNPTEEPRRPDDLTSRRPDSEPLRIVVMGRPNAGKSSLVNSILGEERVIVSAIAHTTREPQDTELEYKGRKIILVDTAGMRKRSHVKAGLEEEGVDRNRAALDTADIAFLIFDASEDPRMQDKRLSGLMKDANKGLILIANKWDLVEGKTTGSTDAYELLFRHTFPFLNWAPIVFVSAKTGQRTQTLLDLALKIEVERNRKIDYNACNRFLKTILKQKRPIASYGPKSPYIHDMAQVGVRPPTFLLTIRGEKVAIHPSWLKFLEKRLRDKFGFEGTPIVAKVEIVPMAKTERARNVKGPGMAAVAGKLSEPWRNIKPNRRRRP
jgi:GTP-binding protein